MAGKTALGKKNEEADGVQEQEDDINRAQTTATAASAGVAVSDNGVTANVVEVDYSHNFSCCKFCFYLFSCILFLDQSVSF